MDAKKCDRCGRFYEEYGKCEMQAHDLKVEKPSMIRTGTETKTGKFVYKKHYDLCPLCMKQLNEFLKKDGYWIRFATDEIEFVDEDEIKQ